MPGYEKSLGAELISLMWNHPTAFFLFLGAGASLISAGILLFSTRSSPRPSRLPTSGGRRRKDDEPSRVCTKEI
jgi:hypothetical protein